MRVGLFWPDDWHGRDRDGPVVDEPRDCLGLGRTYYAIPCAYLHIGSPVSRGFLSPQRVCALQARDRNRARSTIDGAFATRLRGACAADRIGSEISRGIWTSRISRLGLLSYP